MMRSGVFVLGALLAGSSLSAVAGEVPRSCGADFRVRCEVYNQGQVTEIVAPKGRGVAINFANGETITDVGFGDLKAWNRDVSTAGTQVFVSPNTGADTNMWVTTKLAQPDQNGISERHYLFDLTVSKDPAQKSNEVFGLTFQYPADAKAARIAKAKARVEESSEKVADQRLDVDWMMGVRNWRYVYRPSNCPFRPMQDGVSDNGRSTAMRFPDGAAVPAVYQVNPDGTEALTTTDMKADVLVVETTAQLFRLRMSGMVCEVMRVGPGIAYDPGTGTSSPSVVRKVRRPAVHRPMAPLKTAAVAP